MFTERIHGFRTGAADPQAPTRWSTLALSFASMPPTKANSHKLAGAGYYLTWREQMVKEVENGKKPPPELLTLLEASLYKLSDDDLRDEYRWYAERYMHDESEIMRAACEMIVIRVGEIVNGNDTDHVAGL